MQSFIVRENLTDGDEFVRDDSSLICSNKLVWEESFTEWSLIAQAEQRARLSRIP